MLSPLALMRAIEAKREGGAGDDKHWTTSIGYQRHERTTAAMLTTRCLKPFIVMMATMMLMMEYEGTAQLASTRVAGVGLSCKGEARGQPN